VPRLTERPIQVIEGACARGFRQRRERRPIDSTALTAVVSGWPNHGSPAGIYETKITVNQMYVQYRIPANGDQHFPAFGVHGRNLADRGHPVCAFTAAQCGERR